MPERSWGAGLSPAQADGRACVVCGRSLRARGSVAVPVGWSSTGSSVFACASCAGEAAELAGWLVPVPAEALTAAGAAFLAALQHAAAATPTGDPRHAYPDELIAATVHAAAPLITAAELRRLAQQFQRDAGHVAQPQTEYGAGRRAALLDCADTARGRADEVDPAGSADR